MKLSKLEIELHQWGPMEGKYAGTIEFVGETGSQKLVLDPQISADLLSFCADAMTNAAKAAADNFQTAMKASVEEAKKVHALTA